MSLIERSAKVSTPYEDVQPKMPYFLLTQRKEELLELAYYSIAASLAPKATAVLAKIADASDEYSYPPTKGSLLDFWGTWKHSFFCRRLPLQSVLKIVDVYMGEGHKAVLRIALALLELHAPALAKGKCLYLCPLNVPIPISHY